MLKTIATLAVGLPLVALATALAASRLYQGLAIGQISTRISGLDTGYARLISFDSDPIQFTLALIAAALVVAFGLFVFAGVMAKGWRWFSCRQ